MMQQFLFSLIPIAFALVVYAVIIAFRAGGSSQQLSADVKRLGAKTRDMEIQEERRFKLIAATILDVAPDKAHEVAELLRRDADTR